MSCTPIACQCPLALRWTHSIVHAPDFITTWEAIDDAFYKTQWFGSVPGHASGLSHAPPRTPAVTLVTAAVPSGQPQRRASKKVRFCKVDTVRFIVDRRASDFVIPNGLLSFWADKPWHMYGHPDESIDEFALMQTNATITQYPIPRPCSWPAMTIAEDVQAIIADSNPGAALMFISYGLHETSVGTRSFTLQEIDLSDFVDRIQETWHEYRDSEFRVYLVKPQPRGNAPGVHVIVEFIKQEEPHGSIVPTLDETIVWSAYGQPDIERHALYHQRRLRHADVVSSFTDLCHRAHFTCVARAQGKILRPSWTREIGDGALVQLHAFPPRFHEPAEFTDYIYGLPSFLEDSVEMLNEVTLPTLMWRMHLLLDDGYQGVAESEIPITSFASASAAADRAFDHWNLQLPGALSYAGLQWPGDAVQHFIAFDPDAEGYPCIIQAVLDEALELPTPPPTAAYAPAICTIASLVNLLNAPWILEMSSVTITVSDGRHSFDMTDRFRPRHGDFFTVFVRNGPPQAPLHDGDVPDESSLISGLPNINLGTPHVIDRWCGSLEDAEPGLEIEELAMMQRPPSHTPTDETASRFVLHIFARRDRHSAFGTETTEQLVDQIVEQWRLGATGDNSIAAIHPIIYPPHFVAGSDTLAYIIEMAGDAMHRVNVDDVLIVVQVRFQHSRTRFVKDRVQVVWCPKSLNRRGMLSFLRARQFCYASGVGCYLQANGRDWADDETTRRLDDGDFIHLLIDSRTEQWCDLQRAERLQRGFIFTNPLITPGQARRTNHPVMTLHLNHAPEVELLLEKASHYCRHL